MGKQHAFTPEELGENKNSHDIFNNPAYQIAQKGNAVTNAALDRNKSETTQAFDQIADTNLTHNEFDRIKDQGIALSNNTDPIGDEHALADSTSGVNEMGRAIVNFLPGAVFKGAEMIQNTISAGAKLAGLTDFSDFVGSKDNDLNKMFSDVSEEMKLKIPSSAKYDDGNLAQKLLTTKFWTTDIAEGAQFVSALGYMTAGFGEGLTGLAESSKAADLVNKIPLINRIATATAEGLSTKTVGFINAAGISGMQARGTKEQIEAKIAEKYSNEINPDTGLMFTPDEIKQKIADNRDLIDEKVNNTFWATMATELMPAMYASKLFLGRGKQAMGQLNEDIIKAVNSGKMTLEDIKSMSNADVMAKLAKSGFGTMGKEMVKAATTGTLAMNLQQSIQQYDVDQAVGGKGGNIWDSKYGYVKQFLDSFTNSEGIKSMVLGAVLGAGSAGFATMGADGVYNEAMGKHLESMKAADGLYGGIYGEAYRGIHQIDMATGQLKLDDQGMPIPDPEKIKKLVFGQLQYKELFDSQMAAMVAGNPDIATMNEHIALSQAIASELQSGRYENSDQARQFLKWFHKTRINEQGKVDQKEAENKAVADSAQQQAPNPEQGMQASAQTQSALSPTMGRDAADISKEVNKTSGLIDRMIDMWDKTQRQGAKLNRIGDSAAKADFNDNVKRALFYENAKRESLEEMMKQRDEASKEPGANREQLASEIELLGKLHQDSLDRSSDYLNKPDEIFKEWDKFNTDRSERLKDYIESKDALDKEPNKENTLKRDVALYKMHEFNTKEGIGTPQIDKNGNPAWVKGGESSNGTNFFAINQNPLDRQAVPVGLRNEAQYKAGGQYKEMLQLHSMIDSASKGEIPLKEVLSFAHDRVSYLDKETQSRLQDLIESQNRVQEIDKQKLGTMDPVTFSEEGGMDINPEYSQLDEQIKDREEALKGSKNLLERKVNDSELERAQRSPEKQEEYLNKKHAQSYFQRADNVLANALEDDGSIKETYADSAKVNRAMQELQFMRDAIAQRIKDKELPESAYQELVDKADQVLSKLQDIRTVVAENEAKRDMLQKLLGQQHTVKLISAMGYNMETNNVDDPGIFNIVDQALGGTLLNRLSQVDELGNSFEAGQALLHTIKTAISDTDKKALGSALEDKIASSVNTLPDLKVNKNLKVDFGSAPETYIIPLLRSLTDGKTELNEGKASPINRFMRDNDIDRFSDDVAALPQGDTTLGMPKETVQIVLKAYKDVVAANSLKRSMDSALDLSSLVKQELATPETPIVPTVQQEVALRDALTWLNSNKEIGTSAFSGWVFLRGIAGTGKTSVVMKWFMALSGLKPEEVMATAATETASKILNGHLGMDGSQTVADIMNGEIPQGKKLIILDEYARLKTDQLNALQNKIQVHNKGLDPSQRVRIMILGDPTQITPEIHRNRDITDPTSNVNARNIRVINPLTVVYRSDVSAVTQTSDIFQGNPSPVGSISVVASTDKFTPGALGSHTGKSAEEMLSVFKANATDEIAGKRDRVIIVDTQTKYDKYHGMGFPVINVYDAQSATYDEVYVDLDAKNFHDPSKFNDAMYTASSRAQEYSYIKYAEGTNMADPGIITEKANNDKKSQEARKDYIAARTAEAALMEQGAKGEDFDVPQAQAIKQENQSPLDIATDPEIDPEEQEIVTETPSVSPDQELPGTLDPVGTTSPDDEAPVNPVPVITVKSLSGQETLLPNIESAAFPALKGHDRGSSNINAGSIVHYIHTKETNGQDSVTVIAKGEDGLYVPVSKIFQGEVNKYPVYADLKEALKHSIPISLNDIQPTAIIAGKEPTDPEMSKGLLKTAAITRVNRLTYDYSGNGTISKPLLQHISDLFTGFYPDSAKKRAEQVHYKIFRKNELQSDSNSFRRGFRPEPGIPYAIVGIKPGSTNYEDAQFTRLSVKPYTNQSEHFNALKEYTDTAEKVQQGTGIQHGSTAYSKMIKALKGSLEVHHEAEPTGTVPKLRIRANYTPDEFEESLNTVNKNDKSGMPAELDQLLSPENRDNLKAMLPHMQALAGHLYGVKETPAIVTKEEAAQYPDHEHIPLKGEPEDGKGKLLLKNTGGTTGIKAKYHQAYEVEAGKGPAQQAFNQLAKANEFVGATRIRVDDIAAQKASKGRATVSTGKSLMTDAGGFTAVAKARPILAELLGRVKVAKGELSEEDLDRTEVKGQLQREVRQIAGENNTGIVDTAHLITKDSSLDQGTLDEMMSKVNQVAAIKDTNPVNLDTLKLMTGDENFDQNGSHKTQEKFNIQDKRGNTRMDNTYLRQPLEIDKFNKLGLDPKGNADTLSSMVTTKLETIHPTQIAVSEGKVEETKVKPVIAKTEPKSLGNQTTEERLAELRAKLTTVRGKEMKEVIDEIKRLTLGDSPKFYESGTRGKDVGTLINADQARELYKSMLPGASPEDLQFLDRLTMLTLQKPGENLLGLFSEGKVFLREDDGQVGSKVLRHEIFHAIYNDYLSDRERKVLTNAFDPMSKMDPKNLEEALADHFMNWQREPESYGSKVKRIFNKLLSWFGFAKDNVGTINSMFKRIEDGEFQYKTMDTSNTRMAFSDLKEYDNSIQEYKNTASEVQQLIYKHYVDDNINHMPLTYEELLPKVYSELQDRYNAVSAGLDDLVEKQQAALRDYELESDPEIKQDHVIGINAISDLITEENQKLATLYRLTKVDENGRETGLENLKDLWKDLYPNFKAEHDLENFQEIEEREDPDSTEVAWRDENEKSSSDISDFTKQSDERNGETKITENVKNFLSFVFSSGKNPTRVNPRFVYLQALRSMSSLSDPLTFSDEIRKRAVESGIDLSNTRSDAAVVVNHILRIIDNATGDRYTFTTGELDSTGRKKSVTVELHPSNRFLDENTFVTHFENKDISRLSPEETRLLGSDQVHILARQKGQTTAEFITEVGEMLGDTASGLQQAKGHFRQLQAQVQLSEIASTFLSQRESSPMIAEEDRKFVGGTGEGQGYRFDSILKYFRAQTHGIERVQAVSVENAFKKSYAKISQYTWAEFNAKVADNNKAGAIATLAKALGLKGYTNIPKTDTKLVGKVYDDLQTLNNLVKYYTNGIANTIDLNDDSSEEVEIPDPVQLALADHTGLVDRLNKLLSTNSADQRASSYTDVNGTKKYIFHQGSQATDILTRMASGKDPVHFSDPVLSKNIFAKGGNNTVLDVLDHDGQRQKGKEAYAVTYAKETNAQWLKRNFSDAFLSFIKTNASNNSERLTYMQNFATISNRPRMLGAEVRVLHEGEIKEALIKGIEQHLEQPDRSDVKNYDRFKAVNFDEMHKAIEELHKDTLKDRSIADHAKDEEGRAKLDRIYKEIAGSDKLKSDIADHMIGSLKGQAGDILDALKKEKVTLSSDSHLSMKLLKDPRRAVLPEDSKVLESTINTKENYPDPELLRSTVELFNMNNYVNSFFLTQSVAGNLNYFKDGEDLTKRMSGIFAPGTKGMIFPKFFMPEKFRMAVSSDVKMKSDMLSPIFKDSELQKSMKKEGFDITDAQGFMLPERSSQITQGFGKSYKGNTIFKPAHYEVADRGDNTYVPVMAKYSSIVLTDELVDRFPKLAELREAMREHPDGMVHEFLFNTGIKVGAPTVQVEPGSGLLSIPSESVLSLSNDNYRLQLNPNREEYNKVTSPSQLGYFLNVMHKMLAEGAPNIAAADALYGAVAEKIQRGLEKMSKASLDQQGKFRSSVLAKAFTGVGDERIQEMLRSGISYNFPNIANKALIQVANMTYKRAMKIELPGGKLVLQSSFGVEIPPEIKPEHDKFWSAYGKQEAADLQEKARGLEYKVDPITDRWHAEVILPMAYKDKANPGDFLTGDGMGFRIPSTELHSSVPFKVAGYYDDKGSNVIIAPPELVAQHGSDFDVDSLSVVTREQSAHRLWSSDGRQIIDEKEPVGYYRDEATGKLVFNGPRFRAELERLKQETIDPKVLSKIERVHDQFLNNVITESFMDTISHATNMDRMLTPISTQVLTDTLDKLGIEPNQKVNSSRLLDNMRMFNSNFQGVSLTGIFANGMKALSYLSRTGPEGDYPQLQGENPGVNIGGKIYDKFTELSAKGQNLWHIMDALVNTATDNVKEQKLYLMNATDRTGPVYIAAKAMGMELEDAMRLMLQPVIKRFSTIDGSRTTMMNNLKQEMAEHAVSLGLIDEPKYTQIEPALQGRETKMPTNEDLSNAVLDKTINQEVYSLGNTPEEFAHQFHVLKQFEKLQKIGDDITDFSRIVSLLREMPVFYEDIAGMQDLWDKLGTIQGGKFFTSDKFSFNIDNLFEAQPNIAKSYEAFQWMRTAIDKSFIKHYPEFQAFAKDLSSSIGIRLAPDSNLNVEKIKNEVMSYMVSSYYSDRLANQEPVDVSGKKGRGRVVTGKVAWGQEFTSNLDQVLSENRKLETKDQNPFLKRLEVKDDGYGIRSVIFANSSNPSPEEAMEMQEGFSAIKDEQLKHDMVMYAALNYGMSFGLKNYSMFIPSEYLKPLSDFITTEVKDRVLASKVEDGKVVSGPLANLRDNFAIKLAVNNVENLPSIPSRKIAPMHMKDEDGEPKYLVIGDSSVPVRSGYNGEYFWNLAYENPQGERGRKYDDSDLPEFIKKNEGSGDKPRPVAYIRVNDTDNDQVYYQRLGFKNYQGGYDGTDKAIDQVYDRNVYFGKGSIPVAVPDVRADQFTTYNEHVKEGQQVVVYPYSNETRENGISGIVKSVTGIDGGEKTFTLEPDSTGEANTPAEVNYMAAIANEVASRFGLKVEVVDNLGAKGSYKNGVITLDSRTMTPDTAFHEVAHPLIAGIQKLNPAWYQSLVKELKESPEGRILLRKVTAAYPELKGDNLEREALVTAIGQKAANKVPEGKFSSLIGRLMRSIGQTLKDIITKLKGGGSFGLEDLKNEDMVKLKIRDIADLLSSPEAKLKLDLSKVDTTEGEPDFSKDLDEPKGTIDRILKAQDDIKDPEVDEKGMQADHYTVGSDLLQRVSRVMDQFSFRNKTEMLNPDGSKMTTEQAIAKRTADRVFRNVPPGTKLIVEGVEMDKDTYQKQREEMQLKGQLKGDIIHAHLQSFFTQDPDKRQELANKINTLSLKAGVKPDTYSWILEKKVLSRVLENAGIHTGIDIPEAKRDKIYSEVKVASPELGAGKIDELVVKPDGRFRITDWKTGAKLKDRYTSNIMRYGNQENIITDNPIDRAKLQVMLYAMIVKAEHPEARFEGLNVMHIPNEYEAMRGRNSLNVEVGDYVRMIEQYYRNEEPEKYKSLLLKSPQIFDPNEYNAPRDADYTQDVLNSNKSTEIETLQKLKLQLQTLTTSVELRMQQDDRDRWTPQELNTRDALMKKILQGSSILPVNFTGELDSKYEVSVMTHYLGSLNDTHNPYIQAYAQMLNTGKEAARAEFAEKQKGFKALLGKVLEEKKLNQNIASRALFWVNKQKAFGNLWEEKETTDPDTGVKYLERGLAVKGSEQYKKLSANEKALVDYMQKEMKDIFHEVMLSGKDAIVGTDNKGKPMTKLDVLNRSARGAAFTYKDNFVPRVAITHEEVLQRAKAEGIAGVGTYLKDAFLRRATDFFENNVEGYNQKDFGLPVRFLGNSNTYASPDIYSTDLQLAFEKYMEQMTAKKHLDHSWMAGQALKGYLETRRDENGNPAFKHAAQFLDFQMNNRLIGDRLMQNAKRNPAVRNGITVGSIDGKPYKISPLKIYRTLKSGVAAASLYFMPVNAIKNSIQLNYMVAKEKAINDILRLPGMKANKAELDLSFSTYGKDYIEAIGSQFTQLAGNPDKNFVHQLAKSLRLYGTFNEMGVSPSDSMTRGSRLLSSHTAAYMYQAPEEITNVKYGLSFLKNMKIQGGKYEGKSMYDMYKDSFDPNTGTFNLPKDFSRGKIQLPDGTFDELKGLHPMEIQKLQRGIAAIQGGYRADDKTAIQATILGDMFMMFKRWIPGMLVGQFKSKFEDPSIGQFEKVLDKDGKSLMQRDGEDVYAWRARVVEGRALVMGKLIASYVPFLKAEGYHWADLSTQQKKGVIDFGIAMSTWVTMLTIGSKLLGQKKDTDPGKQFMTQMTQRLFEQWSPYYLGEAALQSPSVIKKSLEAGQGLMQLLTGGINEATGGPDNETFKANGDRKGMVQLEKNIPIWNSWYQWHKGEDSAEHETLWDEVTGF